MSRRCPLPYVTAHLRGTHRCSSLWWTTPTRPRNRSRSLVRCSNARTCARPLVISVRLAVLSSVCKHRTASSLHCHIPLCRIINSCAACQSNNVSVCRLAMSWTVPRQRVVTMTCGVILSVAGHYIFCQHLNKSIGTSAAMTRADLVDTTLKSTKRSSRQDLG